MLGAVLVAVRAAYQVVSFAAALTKTLGQLSNLNGQSDNHINSTEYMDYMRSEKLSLRALTITVFQSPPLLAV